MGGITILKLRILAISKYIYLIGSCIHISLIQNQSRFSLIIIQSPTILFIVIDVWYYKLTRRYQI